MPKLKMHIKSKLDEIGLNSESAIVIGSGILSALGLRKSRDIDLVVTKEKYKELYSKKRFKKQLSHGRELLTDNLFEIGKDWVVLGKTWRFNDLIKHSTIIGGVRYITIEFLLKAKREWLANGDIRQKDIDDVKLMEKYVEHKSR